MKTNINDTHYFGVDEYNVVELMIEFALENLYVRLLLMHGNG